MEEMKSRLSKFLDEIKKSNSAYGVARRESTSKDIAYLNTLDNWEDILEFKVFCAKTFVDLIQEIEKRGADLGV